ncbi:hypothetical protein ACFLZX_04150 [Nanoarchaeota archaeon]
MSEAKYDGYAMAQELLSEAAQAGLAGKPAEALQMVWRAQDHYVAGGKSNPELRSTILQMEESLSVQLLRERLEKQRAGFVVDYLKSHTSTSIGKQR